MTLTQKEATEGQVKQISRVAADAATKAVESFGLDKDGAQRVHARGDELVEAILAAVTASLKNLSVTDKYKDEEVESQSGYSSGYTKPASIVEQTNRLQELFPGLGTVNLDLAGRIRNGEVQLPKQAEGWFAIPNWMKHPRIFGTTYGEALQKVLDVLAETLGGKFLNHHEGELGADLLRQSSRSVKFWNDLSEAQGNPDILIVPATFGLRHRGRSVRRAREVFLGNEFGLGAFAVGIMLLTHPKRLEQFDDLWIDCAGDDYAPGEGGVFSGAPCFGWDRDGVWFDASGVDDVDDSCGPVSGFSVL